MEKLNGGGEKKADVKGQAVIRDGKVSELKAVLTKDSGEMNVDAQDRHDDNKKSCNI